VSNITRCKQKEYYRPGIDEPCVSVGYGIIGDSLNINDKKYDRYHEIMQNLAKNNGLELGKDVKPLVAGGHMKLESYLENNKNTTQYVIMFCHEEWREQLEMTSFAMNISHKE
jgi:hypothetical protein